MATAKKAEKQHNGKEATRLWRRRRRRRAKKGCGSLVEEEEEGKGGCRHYSVVRTRFMAPPTCSECGSGEPLPPGEITGHRISREAEQRWWRR